MLRGVFVDTSLSGAARDSVLERYTPVIVHWSVCRGAKPVLADFVVLPRRDSIYNFHGETCIQYSTVRITEEMLLPRIIVRCILVDY